MLTTHDIPDELRAMRLAEVDATARAINLSEMEIHASNCGTFSAALIRDGRINEGAFWAKMGAKAAEERRRADVRREQAGTGLRELGKPVEAA